MSYSLIEDGDRTSIDLNGKFMIILRQILIPNLFDVSQMNVGDD